MRNLRRGNFAYGRGQRDVPQGVWYELWQALPDTLRDMFVTTFTVGADAPIQRATLPQWHAALSDYRDALATGKHTVHLATPGRPQRSQVLHAR